MQWAGHVHPALHAAVRRDRRGLRRPRRHAAVPRIDERRRHLPRPDHDGRLPLGALRVEAAAHPRLRLPGRLGFRGHLHHRGAGRATSRSPSCWWSRTRCQRDPRPALRGDVRHGAHRARADARRSCGRAPTSRPPTSTPRSSTTASRSSCSSGSRRSGSAGGRGGRVRAPRATRASAVRCRSTPTAARATSAAATAPTSASSRPASCAAQSGERQVDGAEVAVWTNAVGPFAAGAILTKG